MRIIMTGGGGDGPIMEDLTIYFFIGVLAIVHSLTGAVDSALAFQAVDSF